MIEEDINLLLAHGEIWLPIGLILKRGEPCGCHRNTARLWAANPEKLVIATGYYLSQDGMWRAHSWCLRATSRGGRIVETTNKALLYFGIPLNQKESADRWENSF